MIDPFRHFWFAVGLAATAFAIAGVFLPLLPTTPFLLLAAFAFARSSPRLHGWLVTHRHFGPMIENWRMHGAIARRAKIAAIAFMAAAVLLSWLTGFSATVIVIQVAIMACVAAFILTRPDAPSS
ncbi:MAG: DUF454 family protein [Rhizobiaceae bacterium]